MATNSPHAILQELGLYPPSVHGFQHCPAPCLPRPQEGGRACGGDIPTSQKPHLPFCWGEMDAWPHPPAKGGLHSHPSAVGLLYREQPVSSHLSLVSLPSTWSTGSLLDLTSRAAEAILCLIIYITSAWDAAFPIQMNSLSKPLLLSSNPPSFPLTPSLKG